MQTALVRKANTTKEHGKTRTWARASRYEQEDELQLIGVCWKGKREDEVMVLLRENEGKEKVR